MNTITFQPPKNDTGFPNKSGVTTPDVWNLISQEPIRDWKVKEICVELGLDPHLEFDIKNVSNRCGYLVNDRHLAVRVDQGVYRALNEKEREMLSMNDPMVREAFAAERTAEGSPQPTVPEFQCEECGFVARSQMGLRTHITKNHKKNQLPQDEVFARVAEATKILFPDPETVFERFEEIAELRKAMFRALAR